MGLAIVITVLSPSRIVLFEYSVSVHVVSGRRYFLVFVQLLQHESIKYKSTLQLNNPIIPIFLHFISRHMARPILSAFLI
jgi:hypothetical protein